MLGDDDGVDIDAVVLEPALSLGDLYVVTRHLTLRHEAVLVERPVLEGEKVRVYRYAGRSPDGAERR